MLMESVLLVESLAKKSLLASVSDLVRINMMPALKILMETIVYGRLPSSLHQPDNYVKIYNFWRLSHDLGQPPFIFVLRNQLNN